MRHCAVLFALASSLFSQTNPNSDYRIALPEHKGQLRWSNEGFKILENSAKPQGKEIGLRGQDASGRLSFLGFLFLTSPPALTGAKCRDEVMALEKKGNAGLKIVKTSEMTRAGGLPVELVTYTTPGRDSSLGYMVRGFIASGDLCGDLEFYSSKPITEDDAELQKIFSSYQLDSEYAPRFSDVALYAQVLYRNHQYGAAGPIFEKGLTMVPEDGAPFASALLARRIMRDQAGMSYGISGDVGKARKIFEKGVAEDPDYPLNYYNLACADAGESKLDAARKHLQQAFDRKASMNPGEAMPVPTKDDSFLPYRSDKKFWAFLEALEAVK